MRFTFREEKNSDSRESNHNTLTQKNLQPVGITVSPSVLLLKSRFGEKQTTKVQTKSTLPRQNKWLTGSSLRDSTCRVSMADVE